MSEQQRRVSLEDLDNPICDTCGFEIDDAGQDCRALDDKECAP